MRSALAVRSSRTCLALALAAVLGCASRSALAQNDPQPGFNLFSVQQDVEIGRQSAAQAERQLPVLRDAALDRYLNRLATDLGRYAPGAKFQYRVRAVNSAEINAFTFPGGFLYVNRGLIEAARNESELAGVLGHEIAHAALRHGTRQASKAYAAQAGIGILGGLLGGGRSRSATGDIVAALGGVGLNAVFLKFSRNDENEADLAGIRMMAKAGYDPTAMASFFDLLKQQQARDPGRLEQFFSSHPAPADRAERMRAEAEHLGPAERRRDSAEFARVHDELRSLPSPQRRTAGLREGPSRGPRGEGTVSVPDIDPPSSRMRTFAQQNGFFEIDYPANWQAYPADRGLGVVIAPEQGIQSASGSGENIVYGVILNHYDPFEGDGNGTLEDATDDLLAQIQRGSPYLREAGGSERRERVDDARALSVVLRGRSPQTGEDEQVKVLTRELTDGHVLYALFVTPRDEASRLEPTFERMVESLRVNDRVVHR
jgi:Zn-dependent protease with chaperone function